MKVLNLYAGLGGNRKLWKDVEVTAVEIDPEIAGIYRDFYPDDTVIVGDAHEYLINHLDEYDFIWSSPECPTHSQYRQNVGVRAKGFKLVYPDMSLWQEIIILAENFTGKWVVENTEPYYELPHNYPPQIISRHYFWSNYFIPQKKIETTGIRDKSKIEELEQFLGFDLSPYSGIKKRKILRNCVNPELGLHVFESRNFLQQSNLL